MDNTWITFNIPALIADFGPATVEGLTFGAIYALIAVGYTLVYGVLGLINFAHAEFFLVGAYALVISLSLMGFGVNAPDMSLPVIMGAVLVAVIIAMICSGATALIVERVAYKPLRARNAPKLAFLITAIGCSFIIQYLFFLRSPNPEPALTIIPRQVLVEFGNTEIDNVSVFTIVAAVVMMIIVDQFIRRSRLGRGIRAVAQDPNTASLMGVNRERVIMLTFVIGGILAGAATIFYVLKVPSGVQFNAGIVLGLKAFTAAVLGGIGNLRGALLGGLIIGLIGNYGQLLLGNSQWSEVVVFVTLILVLLIRPSGILGEALGKARV